MSCHAYPSRICRNWARVVGELPITKFEFTCWTHQINVVRVNLPLAFLSTFAVIGALSGSADDVLPRHFKFDRYRAMVDHSPFAVATAVALPEATPGFAKDLYIANAARSPEGDMVTLMSSSDQNFKKYLTTREPLDGYSIAQIDWSEDVGKTKVTISKDGQFATLTFNQSLLAQQLGPPNARSVAAQQRQAVPLVPPSVSGQAPRPRKPDPAPLPMPNLVSKPESNLEVSQVMNAQQRLEQQRQQHAYDEDLAREKKEKSPHK
jgi:hypothetical protein